MGTQHLYLRLEEEEKQKEIRHFPYVLSYFAKVLIDWF